MTRSILYLLVLSTIISCKKKEQATVSPANTNSPQTASYECNLKTNLILTRNLGVFDTTFTFIGSYMESGGTAQTIYNFPTTNYSGYLSNSGNSFNSQILTNPNFIKLASYSNWNIISPDFGDFQLIDSTTLPYISTNLTVIPTTFDASQGIPIKISGLQGSTVVALRDLSEPGLISLYSPLTFPSTLDTIRDTIGGLQLTNIPINSNFTLSIFSMTKFEKYINGNYSFISKTTTYNYPIKRIN